MEQTVHKTYLFVPGNRPDRFDKACAAGADAVILDLEDAVPESDKPAARRAVESWLASCSQDPGGIPLLLRINATDSKGYLEDLPLSALPGIAGIMLSKAELPETVAEVRRAGAPLVIPLIETARGFANAQDIAAVPGVQRLAFGSIDFRKDLYISGKYEELAYFRSHLVLVSRLAGILPPIDGVTLSISDAKLLREETRRARRSGFGAKLCIHPAQVGVVNEEFLPSAEEVSWAQRVVAAAEAAHGRAVAVDGEMVDRPVVLAAREILRKARKDA